MSNPERIKPDHSTMRQEIAFKIAPLIGELFPEVQKIMLFGSSAINYATVKSDIDLALVTGGQAAILTELIKIHRRKQLTDLLATQSLKLGDGAREIHLTSVMTEELINLESLPEDDPRKKIVKNIKTSGFVVWQREQSNSDGKY